MAIAIGDTFIFLLNAHIFSLGEKSPDILQYDTPPVHLIQLLETDVFGVLPEALSAHVQVVLADETMTVRAGPAVMKGEGFEIQNF